MSSGTSPAKVLIVGAGAMGLTLGHHLQLAGAEIAFLVRESRAPLLGRPQILYSYDDASLKTLSGFRVITSPEAAGALKLDYVVVTLDGAATRSPEGSALLAALGEAIAGGATVMIGGGVGLGLREHYLATTGLPAGRLLMGVLGSFAYQVGRAELPLHPPTDPAVLGRADIAYRHYDRGGFTIENRSPAAKRFARLYDANGARSCTVIEPHLFDILSTAPFPIFAGSELMGWPPASELTANKEVWRLTTGAVREIALLDQHGWRGKLAGLLLTAGMVAKMLSALEKRSLPLDLQAFNAFQHGAKVAVQDRAIMRSCVAAGERQGKPMSALKELLRRLDAARAA